MKTKTYQRKPKKRKGLGNATAPAQNGNGLTFIQGGNQIQTFVLIVLISIIAFYLIAVLVDVVRTNLKKQADTKAEKEVAKIEEVGTNTNVNANTSIYIPTTNEPIHATPAHELQWLLNKAGYNTGGVDGVWGTYSNLAMRQFEKDFGVPFQSSIVNAIPVVRQVLKNKNVLRGVKPKQVFL